MVTKVNCGPKKKKNQILVSAFWIPFKTLFFDPNCPSATGHHLSYYHATYNLEWCF